MRRFLLLTGLLFAGGASSAAAGTYREVGDALAALPGQATLAQPPLAMIHGVLNDSADVDLYRIMIINPGAFSATVVGGSIFDTQLFLFNGGGMGVAHDDDTPPGGIFTSTLGAIPPTIPGVYFLAVSEFNRDPVSGGALLIWLSDPVNVERPPDGPGAPLPLTGWIGAGGSGSAGGDYWIQLTGCDGFVPTPQPGMWTEAGDAADLAPGQPTSGTGTLTWIYGALADTLDVDAYCIQVTDPGSFSATVSGDFEFDTQLFLFDPSGTGVTHNDDDPAGGTPHSRITGLSVPAAGNYVLALSAFDRDPANGAASELWLDQPYFTERAPDGPASADPFVAWSGSGNGTGFYGITLTGAQFWTAPTDAPRVEPPRVLSITAFPNPFNPSIRIECSLPAPGRVELAIYDTGGRRVRTLADGPRSERQLTVTWDGRDDAGSRAATGIYFVRIEAAGQVKARKIALLK